jgi:hypothetical protein
MPNFDNDIWLTQTIDLIDDYIRAEISDAVPGGGENVYHVVMEFPASQELAGPNEIQQTLIHFEVDDIMPKRLGFGPGFVQEKVTENDPDPTILTPREGMEIVMNFDVGIWASDKSGGPTARARAYQILHRALAGDVGRSKLRDFTNGGIEIIHYTGGRFITETINDIRVFRSVDSELEVRVFSSLDGPSEVLVDGDTVQQPDLEIRDDSGSLVPLTDS